MRSFHRFIVGLSILSGLFSLTANKLVYSQDSPAGTIEIARQYLKERASDYSLLSDLSDLKFLEMVSSYGADQVRFQQLHQGIPVYGNYVSVGVSKKGARSPQVTSRYDNPITLQSIIPQISAADASSNAQASVGVKSELMDPMTAELVIYPQGMSGKYRRYVLAWEVKFQASEPLGEWDVFIDATTGKILKKFNRLISSDVETPPLGKRLSNIFSVIKSAIWKFLEPLINSIRSVKNPGDYTNNTTNRDNWLENLSTLFIKYRF